MQLLVLTKTDFVKYISLISNYCQPPLIFNYMRKFLSTSQKSQTVKDMDEIGLVTFVHSSRAQRINITVKAAGGVRVAVPRRSSVKAAERFVLSKQGWIKSQLNRLKDSKFTADEYQDAINDLDIDKAAAGIAARLDELAEEFNFSYNRLTIRNQKTRWGSCSAKNNISLNIKLALLPDELRDLIIIHELVHTKVKNHSLTFWQELERIYPNARALDRQINCLGGLLRIPLSRNG